jgi:hypothetical protein
LRSDWSGEEKIWERLEIRMNKNLMALLMYSGVRRSGSGSLDTIYAGADGHAAMHDVTRPCVVWKNCDTINVA